MKARRAKVIALYNGRDISDYIIDFSYTDNTDQTDDISIEVDDRKGLWLNDWFPETGDTINISIEVSDWKYFNDNRSLLIGDFEVDSVEFGNTITINAVSVPISSSARSEKKNKGWENISLSNIVNDISQNISLSLIYETDIDPFYDRIDQNNKSDLCFVEELCKSDGLCMKVSDNKLVIFDESKYDAKPHVLEIVKGESNILGFPKFKRNAKNIYKACEISFFDSETDRTYLGYFEEPTGIKVGHVLKLQESYNSKFDDISLNRKAKSRLREQNKNEWTFDVTVQGDLTYFAGTNVLITGWNKCDGKYHIKSVRHTIGSGGYSVSLNTRRCLEGY